MRKVIAVTGKGGVGKTTSVKMAYDLLLKKYPNATVIDRWEGRWLNDISRIVSVDGVKVGFQSLGDPSSYFPEQLEELVKHGCKVIVCATRTRGATFDAVESLKPKFSVVRISKSSAPSSSAVDGENEKTARSVLAEILKSLVGA